MINIKCSDLFSPLCPDFFPDSYLSCQQQHVSQSTCTYYANTWNQGNLNKACLDKQNWIRAYVEMEEFRIEKLKFQRKHCFLIDFSRYIFRCWYVSKSFRIIWLLIFWEKSSLPCVLKFLCLPCTFKYAFYYWESPDETLGVWW